MLHSHVHQDSLITVNPRFYHIITITLQGIITPNNHHLFAASPLSIHSLMTLFQERQGPCPAYLLVAIQYLKMQRKNYHRKGGSTVMTTRTKKNSLQGKSRDPAPSSRSKEKPVDRQLQNKIKKRMSFESPSRKEDAVSARSHYHNLSLLNYMLFKEKQRAQPTPQAPLAKDQFSVVEILGKGGFGKVYRVEQKRTRAVFAMKEMSKTVIITKKSIESVLNERELLAELKHPFIVNMVYAFQDRLNLYLVMDYMPGGDLRFQLGRCDRFPENVVKFFICSILLSLQYLHGNNIIHRDLKPQNLIFDGKGYIRLTDLGVARLFTPDNYRDTSGTPGYMAPEVINRENHSFEVDYFALGVIAYECMLGKRPYRGYNRQEIREQMLLYEAQVKPHQLPAGFHPDAIDFINRLLKRKATERLGHNGTQEVLSHPWLKEIDWGKMLSKKYPSPFLPNFESRNYDTVSESEYGQETEQRMAENGLLLRKQEVQDLFKGYEYQEVRLT